MEGTTEEKLPADTLTFNDLRSDPGRISLDTVFKELQKLRTIRQLNLPHDLLGYRQETAFTTLRKFQIKKPNFSAN
jgi:hypothetical protein